MSNGPVSALAGILREALDLLTAPGSGDCCGVTPDVCRTALYLGGEVPYDSCDGGCGGGKNGMLWAKVISIDPAAGNASQGPCASYLWTAEVGIVRCVAGSGADGNPPSAQAVEADARQQLKDADTIFAALRCCDDRSQTLRDVALTRWNPVGESPCAGGVWTLRGALSVCC